MLLGIVEALLETLGLFGAADVQEEFADYHAVFSPGALDVGDLAEALKALFSRDIATGLAGDNIFIMRTIEDAELACGGQGAVDAPEVIVLQFFAIGFFEGCDAAMLRIDAGEDVFNRAVLAGGVHSLEDDEQRALVFRCKLCG